jgi:hypothetical protein
VGYNFALNLTSIEGLHKKLLTSKVLGIPILKFLGLPTWVMHLQTPHKTNMNPMVKTMKEGVEMHSLVHNTLGVRRAC